MSVKIIVFDLDQTLLSNGTIGNETEFILELLKQQQYSLAIASYNRYAKWFCDRYDISKYFDIICAEQTETKIPHMKTIMNFYHALPSEMVFFDDKHKNCKTIQTELNIQTYKVDKCCGIRLCDVQCLLKMDSKYCGNG
jgi:predicted phosphatase